MFDGRKQAISLKDTTCATYNFEFEHFHIYFVEIEGVLVHNNRYKLISVKNTEQQIGSSYNTTIEDGNISIEGRAVTNGQFDYIINEGGDLIMGKGHYYMSKAAKGVQAAGTLKLYKGKVTTITNNSGHYKPNASEFQNSISLLKEKGVNLSGANTKLYDSDGKLCGTSKIE